MNQAEIDTLKYKVVHHFGTYDPSIISY